MADPPASAAATKTPCPECGALVFDEETLECEACGTVYELTDVGADEHGLIHVLTDARTDPRGALCGARGPWKAEWGFRLPAPRRIERFCPPCMQQWTNDQEEAMGTA